MSIGPETKGGRETESKQEKFLALFPETKYPEHLDDFFIFFLNLQIDRRISYRERYLENLTDEKRYKEQILLLIQRQKLLFECVEDFGIIIPEKYPHEDIERPDAPEGKQYFDDWYKDAKICRTRRLILLRPIL